jgi:hypothetical protein
MEWKKELRYKLMYRNFFNSILGKDMDIRVQEALRAQNTHDQKGTSPYHIAVRIPSLQNKERKLKATREKHQLTYI